MSYANYTISETNVTTTDIRTATGISTDANVKFSDLFNPAVADINKWSKKKPTDAALADNPDNDYKGLSGDFSLNIPRFGRSDIAAIISGFASGWTYKTLTTNLRISHWRGYYAAARPFFRRYTFPSQMVFGTAIQFKFEFYSDADMNSAKEIRPSDYVKASNGTAINLMNMYPGLILAKGTDYRIKASPKTLAQAVSAGDLEHIISINNPGTSYYSTGTYMLYPILFEGDIGTTIGGTGNGNASIPTGVTGVIPLPCEPWSLNVHSGAPTQLPYLTFSITFKTGARPTITGTMVLHNPTGTSFTFGNVSFTINASSGGSATVTKTQSVAVAEGGTSNQTLSLRFSAVDYSASDTWQLVATCPGCETFTGQIVPS